MYGHWAPAVYLAFFLFEGVEINIVMSTTAAVTATTATASTTSAAAAFATRSSEEFRLHVAVFIELQCHEGDAKLIAHLTLLQCDPERRGDCRFRVELDVRQVCRGLIRC